MEYKAVASQTQSINDREVTGIVAVTGNVDDGQDRIMAGAFSRTIKADLARFKHLWGHDTYEMPTAVVLDAREIGRMELPTDVQANYPDASGGLLWKRRYLDTERGSEALTGIKTGAITEMSIGYLSRKWQYETMPDGTTIRNLQDVTLFEGSDVLWGMNSATRAAKGALPFKNAAIASPTAQYDASGEFAKATIDDLKLMAAWHDPDNPDDKATYKLLHHRSDDGHTVVWIAVKQAMMTLISGELPLRSGDRRAIYNHLSKHYEGWDKEAPDFSLIELGYSLHEARIKLRAESNVKVGRMISATNLAKLQAALDALNELITSAEPPSTDDGKASAVRATMVRMSMIERELALLRT